MLDVIIIGGGICGCSLLYELSRFQVRAALLEKQNDVSTGATKANSALVHAGYDPKPGTLMAKYNVQGNALIESLCGELDILYRKAGSLVIGFHDQDRAGIEKLYRQGVKNGVPGMRMLGHDELHRIEPALNKAAQFALYAPGAGIVNPWELAFAQAEAAILGGAEVHLDTEVLSVEKIERGFSVHTSTGDYRGRFLVNAAGVHAAEVSAMLGEYDFTITPKKGEYYLLDTTAGGLVERVIFQPPTKAGKGVLLAPTVHGNLLVGPSAEPAEMDDVRTTGSGLEYVRAQARRSVPAIDFGESIRTFAGARAVAQVDDFIVGPSRETPGYFRVAGIQSPGLTSAPAIAKDIVVQLAQAGLSLVPNPRFCAKRHILRFKELSDAQRGEAIRKNPLYGKIVCRCQTVTEGEIVDALRRPLPPRSLDAVKRRVGPGMGRCQGGFCGPRVQAIIARELGIAQERVWQDRAGMAVVIGRTKGAKEGDV